MSSKAAAKQKAAKKAHVKGKRHPKPKAKRNRDAQRSEPKSLQTSRRAFVTELDRLTDPAVGEQLPQTLALRTADIDYDGWEAVAMVGVDGITDERRGRRGRRGLFAALQSDNYKRRLAVLHIRERYEADEAAGGIKAAAEGGRFQQILQWMIDHREEIMAFIQMIVGLFSQVPV